MDEIILTTFRLTLPKMNIKEIIEGIKRETKMAIRNDGKPLGDDAKIYLEHYESELQKRFEDKTPIVVSLDKRELAALRDYTQVEIHHRLGLSDQDEPLWDAYQEAFLGMLYFAMPRLFEAETLGRLADDTEEI